MWRTTSDPSGTVADPQVTCGCAGGGKFWNTAGATVADNWVHGNGDVGIWVDTDNSGFDISGNYIASNWAEGIIYEISYNADITDNTLIDNAWGGGPSPGLGGFPDPAALHLGVGERQPSGRELRPHVQRLRERLRRQLEWRRHLRELQPCVWDQQRPVLHAGRPWHLHDVVVRRPHPERQHQLHPGLRRQLPLEVAERLGGRQRVRLHPERHRGGLHHVDLLRLQRAVQ